MDVLQSVQRLGLHKNESSVYVALLSIGRTSVGNIIKKTGLHRMIVYDALDSLVEMRLASCITIRNRKHFQASDPKVLGEHIQQKQKVFESVLPTLQSLQTQADDQLEIKVLYGQSGFIANLEALIESALDHDSIMRISGGADACIFYDALGDWYDDYLLLLQQKKILKHLIAPESAIEFQQKFAKEPGNELRTVQSGLSNPTYTRITPDMVSIEIYAQEVAVIQIVNKSVAQGYLDSFNLLWKNATKFNS